MVLSNANKFRKMSPGIPKLHVQIQGAILLERKYETENAFRRIFHFLKIFFFINRGRSNEHGRVIFREKIFAICVYVLRFP
jgi:hypothetical protein